MCTYYIYNIYYIYNPSLLGRLNKLLLPKDKISTLLKTLTALFVNLKKATICCSIEHNELGRRGWFL
jgi:hypothetical protein